MISQRLAVFGGLTKRKYISDRRIKKQLWSYKRI